MVIGLSGVQFGLYSNHTPVINKIPIMIKDRIGRHEVLLPVNRNYNKICDILGFFQIKIQEPPRFFLLAVKKAIKVRACDGSYCPIRDGPSEK